MKRSALNNFFVNIKKLEKSRLVRDNRNYELGNNLKGDGVHPEIIRIVNELSEFAHKHLLVPKDREEVIEESLKRGFDFCRYVLLTAETEQVSHVHRDTGLVFVGVKIQTSKGFIHKKNSVNQPPKNWSDVISTAE